MAGIGGVVIYCVFYAFTGNAVIVENIEVTRISFTMPQLAPLSL